MQDAVTPFEELARSDPDDARMHSELATTIAGHAAMLALRDPVGAIPMFEMSFARYDAMNATERDSAYNRQNEWFAHCAAAEPLAMAGRRIDAVHHLQRGLAIARDVGTDLRQITVVDMYRYLAARAWIVLGRVADADALLEAAAKSLQPQLATGGIEHRIGTVAVLRELAKIRPAQACELFERASQTWHDWPGAVTPFIARERDEVEREKTAACM